MVVGMLEAARLVGRDRATIWRYAKQGKLSVSLDATGRKQIDTAELVRVFGDLQHPQPLQRNTDRNTVPPAATLPAPLHQVHELERLEAENARLRAELDAERRERREMQDRYMAVIERLSLPGPTATPPATSNNGAAAPRPRRPRRTAAAPEAPTLTEALSSALTGWLRPTR